MGTHSLEREPRHRHTLKQKLGNSKLSQGKGTLVKCDRTGTGWHKGEPLERHMSGNPGGGTAVPCCVVLLSPAALGLYSVGLVDFQGGHSGALASSEDGAGTDVQGAGSGAVPVQPFQAKWPTEFFLLPSCLTPWLRGDLPLQAPGGA